MNLREDAWGNYWGKTMGDVHCHSLVYVCEDTKHKNFIRPNTLLRFRMEPWKDERVKQHYYECLIKMGTNTAIK